MVAAEPAAGECISLVDAGSLTKQHWARLAALTSEDRRRMLVSRVSSAAKRARLLSGGFGDAVSDEISLEELDVRGRRVADQAAWVPRRRVLARLELDLMTREASYAGKALNLYPREFGLLWRLAECPGELVTKEMLAGDVWRLDFLPESNSIAVHLSRLRSKLALANLDGVVETVPGGYRLRCSMIDPNTSLEWPRPASGAGRQPLTSL